MAVDGASCRTPSICTIRQSTRAGSSAASRIYLRAAGLAQVVFGVVPFPTVVHGGLAGCSTQDPGTVICQYDFQPAGVVLHTHWLRDEN
jgi:hypothetical protein